MFEEKDNKQIKERGSDLTVVMQQINHFKNGFPFLDIKRAASIGDGIVQLTQTDIDNLCNDYTTKVGDKSVLKFVPASGAATRMFKDLFSFIDQPDIEKNKAAKSFIDGLKNFAFYDELDESLKGKGKSIAPCLANKDYVSIVGELLNEDGLGYGSLPKALLSFHSYENGSRTPLEEHLVEGAKYAKSKNGVVNLHFTVSPEHQQKFDTLVKKVVAVYESIYSVKFQISFSQQKKSTDTIAVDMTNQPFREEDVSLLFRPAGHGALLENLNDLNADLIYVKNIDNVVPDRLKEDTYNYKMALGSLLIDCQNEIFGYLSKGIDDPDSIAESLNKKYFIEMPSNFKGLSKSEKKDVLRAKLNRPIRVCGMVKNTGEPGGGPFWVLEADGSHSLQIAETAQIDLSDAVKSKMLNNSTHFNPVDLVCATKNYQGKKFDLIQYRNDQTGFISEKSKSGKDLKALELPGLWNGAMAHWITFFVEVPITTFNPVKTVNDLLKDTHQ